MKSKEELTALKEEVEALNKKLRELTGEEFAQVTGGGGSTLTGTIKSAAGAVADAITSLFE